MVMQTVPSELYRVSPKKELGVVYSAKLSRLVKLYRRNETDLNKRGHILLKKAIFATFCELRSEGFADEARELLQESEVPELLA